MRTARRYHTVHIHAGWQLITTANPIPTELRDTLSEINQAAETH